MSNPLPHVEKFIGNTLIANDAVADLVGDRVYSGRPPQDPIPPNDEVYPCIVYTLHTGAGVSALGEGDIQLMELPVYTIKGVTREEDYTTAHAIAHAIHEALRNARGPVTFASRTCQIQGVRKQNWIEFLEEDEERFNHVGATYRVFVSGLG